MGKILQFPKNKKTEEFYQFLVRWSDGATFYGETIEECFRQQKDVFEPEFTMEEYLERFRNRLKVVTGNDYGYSDIDELIQILLDLGYIEVLTRDTGTTDKKL